MTSRRSIPLALLLFLSLAFNALIICSTAVIWPEIRHSVTTSIKKRLNPPPAAFESSLDSIVDLVHSQKVESDTERYVFIRNWVHSNSIHKIDAESKGYAFDTPVVITMLWETYSNEGPPAKLSCGPRALAMQTILNKMRIKNRLVSIFTDNNPQINSHSFIEIWNPTSQTWEAHDPDFNIHYTDRQSGKILNTMDIAFGDLDEIMPRSPSRIGWEANRVGHLKDYFEAILYNQDASYTNSTILINTDKFDASRPFPVNGVDFYEFSQKKYRNPIILENPPITIY